ncbi:MAG: hypothetical protein WDM81_18290 [Rhizomicrobium sp.]
MGRRDKPGDVDYELLYTQTNTQTSPGWRAQKDTCGGRSSTTALEVVRSHMHLETVHDWDGVLATFEHPHYDINDGGGGVHRRRRRAALFPELADAVSRPGQRDHRHRGDGRHRAGRVLADGNASGAFAPRRPHHRADRPRLPRPHGRDVRVQAGLGQDRLRAPYIDPAPGAVDRALGIG